MSCHHMPHRRRCLCSVDQLQAHVLFALMFLPKPLVCFILIRFTTITTLNIHIEHHHTGNLPLLYHMRYTDNHVHRSPATLHSHTPSLILGKSGITAMATLRTPSFSAHSSPENLISSNEPLDINATRLSAKDAAHLQTRLNDLPREIFDMIEAFTISGHIALTRGDVNLTSSAESKRHTANLKIIQLSHATRCRYAQEF